MLPKTLPKQISLLTTVLLVAVWLVLEVWAYQNRGLHVLSGLPPSGNERYAQNVELIRALTGSPAASATRATIDGLLATSSAAREALLLLPPYDAALEKTLTAERLRGKFIAMRVDQKDPSTWAFYIIFLDQADAVFRVSYQATGTGKDLQLTSFVKTADPPMEVEKFVLRYKPVLEYLKVGA